MYVDPDLKAITAAKPVGRPYSQKQERADELLLPVIGRTVKDIEYDIRYCYFNVVFTDGSRLCINSSGCYDMEVELEND